MNIRIFTAEAAAAPVSKSDLRSQRALVRSATKELNKQQKALDRMEQRFAKQNPGAGAAPRNPKPSATAQPEVDLTGISRRELVKMLVESRKLDKPADARGVPVADLRALFLKKRKPRGSRPSPKPSAAPATPAPKASTKGGMTIEKQQEALKGIKKYSPSMKGAKWQKILNANATVNPKQEGFWRNPHKIAEDLTGYPYPVKFSVPGYVKKDFLERLIDIETNAASGGRHERGHSPNRWTGKGDNGSGALKYKGWHWPQGYRTYIKGGMPPTRAFYNHIMGEDLPGLPEYPEVPRKTVKKQGRWAKS